MHNNDMHALAHTKASWACTLPPVTAKTASGKIAVDQPEERIHMEGKTSRKGGF